MRKTARLWTRQRDTVRHILTHSSHRPTKTERRRSVKILHFEARHPTPCRFFLPGIILLRRFSSAIPTAAAIMGDLNSCRLGLSKNYMKRPAKENFPTYTTHQCMVRKHLTLEVSVVYCSLTSCFVSFRAFPYTFCVDTYDRQPCLTVTPNPTFRYTPHINVWSGSISR